MIRTIERNIARNRMADAGVSKINRRMGNGGWRRILYGDLSADADKAFRKATARRAVNNEHKGKLWQTYGR